MKSGISINRRFPSYGRQWPFLASVAIAGVVALGGNHGGSITAAENATPSPSRVPVIAEAVIEMPGDTIAWSVAAINAGARPTDVASGGEPGFVLATQGTAVVRGGDDPEARLKKGDAMELRPEDELTVQTAGASPAHMALLTLGVAEVAHPDDAAGAGGAGEPDEAIRTGEAFDSPGGDREVDLLRDVVDDGEVAEIAAGKAPTFVLVTGGSVAIEAEEGEPEALKAGDSVVVVGEFNVTGAADSSSFVAAIIGDEVVSDPDGAPPTPTTRGQSGPQPTSPASSPTPVPSTPTPTPVPPTPTPDGNGPSDDPDDDGLINSEEVANGTDRQNPDTDADLLNDGDEVHTYTTNPTALDTDADGLYDGDEVIRVGSSPSAADTDGDELWDGREVNELFTNALSQDTDNDGTYDGLEVRRGTDPCSPDPDGDGLIDSVEVLGTRTNPYVYDTDGDGFGDGDEVHTYNTNPNKPDTDDDGLTDPEEAFLATDPRNPDTDGDGYSDGAEINQHRTWPTDATSHP